MWTTSGVAKGEGAFQVHDYIARTIMRAIAREGSRSARSKRERASAIDRTHQEEAMSRSRLEERRERVYNARLPTDTTKMRTEEPVEPPMRMRGVPVVRDCATNLHTKSCIL